jgi:hypothetical protein
MGLTWVPAESCVMVVKSTMYVSSFQCTVTDPGCPRSLY